MSVFREYDIRGLADEELTDSFAWGVGKAVGLRAKARGESRIYLGQDARLSSPRLVKALSAGFESEGLSCRILKLCPTPLLYFYAYNPEEDFQTKTGVMVTGSHNPPEYNGFKIVLGGSTLFGSEIQELRADVLRFKAMAPKEFSIKATVIDGDQRYSDYLKGNIRLGRQPKVVIDAGNGSAGGLAEKTYRDLGLDVVPLFCEPDGRFPNHHPDPTVPKNLAHLIAKVKEVKAELGIAFDGDGDRIGAVSATGRIFYGDQLVLYFARDILKEIPGATVISEVKCSQVLFDTLEKWGAKGILWKTGHSLLKAKLKETHGALAGEMSGHMFFANRYFGFDDAVYAGARLIEGLSNRNETLDQFLDSLPPMTNTPELRVDCPDAKKFEVVKTFTALAKKKYGDAVNDIDGARIKMFGGWGLMRASNTQPVVVMRFEAPDQARLKQIRDEFASLIATVDSSLVVPTV